MYSFILCPNVTKEIIFSNEDCENRKAHSLRGQVSAHMDNDLNPEEQVVCFIFYALISAYKK